MHFDNNRRFNKSRKKWLTVPRDPKPVNLKTLDGQHLLVFDGVVCDECRKAPPRLTLVKLGARLLCVECYGKAKAK